MSILIKHGRVVDPANDIDDILDILVENGKILKLAKDLAKPAQTIIDAKGKIVLPGLVDMHVHLREPGREDKETVASGTQAALKGGVSSVLAMPNTEIPIDCVENIHLLKKIIRESACAQVFIAAAITKGRLGQELTAMAKFKKEGIVAITDDGASVDDAGLFLRALRMARKNELLVICHSEDKSISAKGMVNLGFTSTRMGLRGMSKESEYKRIKRDIELAKKAKAAVHIAHISCRESVELIAQAKKSGLRVTAETAPHYFALTEEAVVGYDTNMKMNPPLRSQEDALAIKQGLKSGVLDVIASDHAPHTENEKAIEFERAEFGVIGLETELAVSITHLVDNGFLHWSELVRKMALNPARILGINKGTLSVGGVADITIVDPKQEWLVRKEDLRSKSKNCAFLGRKLKGVVEYTIYGGKIAYKR